MYPIRNVDASTSFGRSPDTADVPVRPDGSLDPHGLADDRADHRYPESSTVTATATTAAFAIITTDHYHPESSEYFSSSAAVPG